jgi:hypothetical protein
MNAMLTPPRTLALYLGLIAALAVAGCATGPKKTWYKPGMTADDWAIDSADCRSRARRLVEDEVSMQAPMSHGGINQGAGYDALMQGHSARRSVESLYRTCLKRLGYKLVDPPAATPGTKT